jgi:hypothetical protein
LPFTTVKDFPPMLRNEDFISYTLSARIINATSGTEVNPESVYARDAEKVEILEIAKNELKISLPANSCSAGHSLILNITLRRPLADPLEAEIDVIVTSKRNISAEQDEASLELRNPEDGSWDLLLSIFQRRQDDIDNFIGNARGVS